MQYVQSDPPVPSVSRYFRLWREFGSSSTLRKLQYEHLSSLNLQGRMLDVGGGAKAHYRKHLPADLDYESANIDPSIDPTYLVDVGSPLPPQDDSYDCCLSLNTLEHVYQPQFLIGEMYRVLKPGGFLHATVPWMFRIHAHPDDFLRMTPSWWQQAMADAGFERTEVTPLVWGRSSSSVAMLGRKGIRTHLAHFKDVVHASYAFRGNGNTHKRRQRTYNVALGHFISATK